MPKLRLDRVENKLHLMKFATEGDPPDEKTEALSSWSFSTETDAQIACDVALEFAKAVDRKRKGLSITPEGG